MVRVGKPCRLADFEAFRKNDDHPAKFPLMLAKRVIRLFSDKNSVVLDPFLGSGTTAIAAIQTGRQFIGIEKETLFRCPAVPPDG